MNGTSSAHHLNVRSAEKQKFYGMLEKESSNVTIWIYSRNNGVSSTKGYAINVLISGDETHFNCPYNLMKLSQVSSNSILNASWIFARKLIRIAWSKPYMCSSYPSLLLFRYQKWFALMRVGVISRIIISKIAKALSFSLKAALS